MQTNETTTTTDNQIFDLGSIKAEDIKVFDTKPDPIAKEPVNTGLENKQEQGINKEEVKTTENVAAQNEDAKPTSEANAQESQPAPIEIDDNTLGNILGEATNGTIGSVNKLFEIIEENKKYAEMVNNPALLFKNNEQRKIYEFLNKYQGADYGSSLQTYARIQSLDLGNLSNDEIIREDYIIDKTQKGLSRSEAEKLYSHEYESKYDNYGDLAETYKKIEAQDARKRLEGMQKELTTPAAENKEQMELENKRKEAQETYLKSVDAVIPNYKTLSLIGLTENKDDDFHFALEDAKPIENAMKDFQSYFNERYVKSDGFFDAERLAMDLTRQIHQEKIDKLLFDHGINVGKQKEIERRNNIPAKQTDNASTISGQGKAPTDIYEALLGANVIPVK